MPSYVFFVKFPVVRLEYGGWFAQPVVLHVAEQKRSLTKFSSLFFFFLFCFQYSLWFRFSFCVCVFKEQKSLKKKFCILFPQPSFTVL